MFGTDYIAEHILSEIRKENEDFRYKVYVTDILYYSAKGQALTTRYADIVLKTTRPKDTRTGEQIAIDLIKKLGGEK